MKYALLATVAFVPMALAARIAIAQDDMAPPPEPAPVQAPEGYTSPRTTEETVPKTVHGGKHRIKRGGKRIAKGFRGIGRGVKDVFTGKRSKEDFEDATKIGDGAKDVGTGIAGVGRGVGGGVKKSVTEDED